MDVGADAADPLHQRDNLNVVARLGQMLDAAKVEPDMQLGVDYGFAFTDHIQLVRFFKSRMIRPHGDFVAHIFSLPAATASLAATTSHRFTPGVSPWRSSNGSYSRPVKSRTYSS